MKREFYYPSRDGETKIHSVEWLPEGKPCAVLQICHGMCEYIDRYDAFARFLNEYGFVVVGNDHLGHGQSVQSDDMHGFFCGKDGNLTVLKDLHRLRCITKRRYPDIPYFWLGHSMGSFLTRQYIARCGDGLAGVIIMGTGSQPEAALLAGKALCRALAAVHGWHYRSDLVNGMSLGSYNRHFEPGRTKCDWLTKDTQIVDAYVQDPWCTFVFTLNGYYNLFKSIEDAQDPVVIRNIPEDLPMFLVSGLEDPVGDFGRGVGTAYRRYRGASIHSDRSMRLYENDRHEILNETDRTQIYEDLLGWMQMRM